MKNYVLEYTKSKAHTNNTTLLAELYFHTTDFVDRLYPFLNRGLTKEQLVDLCVYCGYGNATDTITARRLHMKLMQSEVDDIWFHDIISNSSFFDIVDWLYDNLEPNKYANIINVLISENQDLEELYNKICENPYD